jgi:hypothetical protein
LLVWLSHLLANQIMRMSGDYVEFDETEMLLIAIEKAGHLSRADALLLQAYYLT